MRQTRAHSVIQHAINTTEPDLGIVTEEMLLEELGTKFRVSNKVEVQHIYFDFGTSHITDESIPSLNIIKNLLDTTPTLQIEIVGHTDNVGDEIANNNINFFILIDLIAKNRRSN